MHLLLNQSIFLTLEMFLKFTIFAQKRLKFSFCFPNNWCRFFHVKHCNFLIKKENYTSHSFVFECFEPSNLQKLQNLHTNNMKKPHKLELFGFPTFLCRINTHFHRKPALISLKRLLENAFSCC